MNRIFSQLTIFSKLAAGHLAAVSLTGVMVTTLTAQSPANLPSPGTQPGYYTDPTTGIVYRKVMRTIDRPVSETKVEKQTQTVYRPETVTETKPSTRTVYLPVVEHSWEPRVHNRWNPFQKPTVAYHHVPRTRWEARAETVQQVNRRTHWVAENRTVEVPRQVVRMQREEKVDYEPVGRVAAPPANGPSSAIASRLRPLAANEQVQPMGTVSGFPATTITSTPAAPQIAASTMGRMTSDPPRRTLGQSGLRAKELVPSTTTVRGQPLPPPAGTGIAMPSIPMFR